MQYANVDMVKSHSLCSQAFANKIWNVGRFIITEYEKTAGTVQIVECSAEPHDVSSYIIIIHHYSSLSSDIYIDIKHINLSV